MNRRHESPRLTGDRERVSKGETRDDSAGRLGGTARRDSSVGKALGLQPLIYMNMWIGNINLEVKQTDSLVTSRNRRKLCRIRYKSITGCLILTLESKRLNLIVEFIIGLLKGLCHGRK